VEAAQDIKKPFVAIAGDAESALPRVKGFDTPEAAQAWAEGTDGASVYKVTGRDAGGKVKGLEPVQTEAGRFQKSKPASAATSAADGAGGFVKGLDEGMGGLPEPKNAGPETIDFSAEGGRARSGRENIRIADLAGKEGAGESVKAGSYDDLPSNARNSYKGYEANGWKGNYRGQATGTKAGKIYQNADDLLPKTDSAGNRITYREFDINSPTQGVGRDAERFVVGSDGSVYYTDSHYGQSTSPAELPPFVKIK
jgi:guanyl-specific ribonuclease Sa